MFGVVVDASCIPARGSKDNDGYFHGVVEWQGTDIRTGELLFASPKYSQSMVNIGEACAIIEALKYLHERGDHSTPVYSDSYVALGWVSSGEPRTKMPLNEFNWEALDKMDELFAWMNSTKPRNAVMKWHTKQWGENPADYGRK